MSGQVRVDIAGRVATVTLDRPPVNALSSGFYTELSAAIERVGADPQVSVNPLSALAPGFLRRLFQPNFGMPPPIQQSLGVQ